ncbi:MAG TPA: GTP cyclohydrolase I FolE, partial [Candidatus Marinimicrobia bacterium]|nr:GTP cyclohydrolase I FolE [Candidatus Neomarinimicrobiota bacterium]
MKDLEKLKEITKILLKEIGEDSNREGLIKTPDRVAKAWEFFSRGYRANVH